MRFPQDIPSDILSRADELLSAKYGTDRPIDPEIVELVCRGMMEERDEAAEVAERACAAFEKASIGKVYSDGVLGTFIAKAIRGTE